MIGVQVRKRIDSISRCVAIALFVVASNASAVSASTWGFVEKTCPLDGKTVRGRVPRSMFIPGRMPDGRSHGGDPFLSGMIQCPHCGFIAHAPRYDAPQGIDKEKVVAELQKLDKSSLFYRIDAASAVERSWKADPHRLAQLALTAKWLADDTGEPHLIHERLQAAIDAQTALVSHLKPDDEDYAAALYLVGELYRQQGNTAEALRWFEKALPEADEFLRPAIEQQRIATTYAGELPAKIIEKLKQASPGEKVAAIQFLRSADDAATLQFLHDVVLKSPHRFREQAIDALLGDAPRKIHLPIYLKAIGDRHYRTVQGGAQAVEILGAKEAAPLLVKALENPVEAADHRLAEALAAVATPAEIPALRRLFRDNGQRHVLLRALINTGSPEIVDDVLNLLDGDAWYLSLADRPEVLRIMKAAAGNAVLMKRLPDLRTAAVDSPAALFKTHVLTIDDKPETADELAAALSRGGPLAAEAAIALARRRDPRSRQVLVDQVDGVVQDSHDGYLVLLPLLQPEDFSTIRHALERAVARRQEAMAELKRRVATETDAEEKARTLERIATAENQGNWWMEPWLRLFGATRHPEAKPLLLKYLDDPNHQARAAAVDGLSYVYDAEIGARLTARLAVEREIPELIVRTLGKSGDPTRLPALLALADKPTLIATKLALIEALRELQAVDRLQPKLESWSRSPDPTLTEAAQRALAGKRKPE